MKMHPAPDLKRERNESGSLLGKSPMLTRAVMAAAGGKRVRHAMSPPPTHFSLFPCHNVCVTTRVLYLIFFLPPFWNPIGYSLVLILVLILVGIGKASPVRVGGRDKTQMTTTTTLSLVRKEDLIFKKLVELKPLLFNCAFSSSHPNPKL